MPITRRRRANPPDQPEDNNHLSDQSESSPETLAAEQAPILSMDGERADAPLNEHQGNTYVSPTSSPNPLGALAYNPGYTGSDEARSMLLHSLSEESNAGGRARCWNCGSIAIAYDCWNTRSKTFGEVGIAFCEICGVWSVM